MRILSSILKQFNPEDPVVGLVRECSEAAAKRGGTPQEVATSAIACLVLKMAAAITVPATEGANPGPAGGEAKEPATS